MYKSKRTQYGGSTASTLDLLHAPECLFCQRSQKFCTLITRALYIKYSASQNYYYQKDINIILCQQRSKQFTSYKEWTYYEINECLKRFYPLSENKQKTLVLTEYYKFHRDIPRLFMQPVSTTLSKYHDKRRRIEYIRITRMLGGHIDQPVLTQHSVQTSLQNLLAQLNFSKQDQSNTIIEIQKNLKEAINVSKNQQEYDSKKYNLPLQLKNSDFYNRSKIDHRSEIYSRYDQKENQDVLTKKKNLKNSAIQTQRELSQPKVYSTEKANKMIQQVPLTQRTMNNQKQQSISPRPTTSRSIKPQIMQLLKPNHVNTNKLKATNIILECLMRKLNLDQKLQQKQKSKSPTKTPAQQANKRKRRVMSTNQETTTKIDLTQLKYKQSQMLANRLDNNNKGYKTGRASAIA